jgi:hypothetical protein
MLSACPHRQEHLGAEEQDKWLTRWVYQNIETGEAIDILVYNRQAFQQIRDRPFFRKILSEGKVLHGPTD